MDSADFIAIVAQRAGIPSSEAADAVRATLETLAERVSEGAARGVARDLPPELRALLEHSGNAVSFDAEEFLRRVGAREGTHVATAERHVRAVLAALRLVADPKELADLESELPSDYRPLLEPSQLKREGPPPLISAQTFIQGVADRTGLDRRGAQQATDAVLQVLAERISGGEVDDLAEELPDELHPPLERGKRLSKGVALAMSSDEFVQRVAELEGVEPGEAQDHVAAVFAALRETVTQKELADITAQLSHDYAALFARP
jgi:uncharacterized protein (DUF2267 family)